MGPDISETDPDDVAIDEACLSIDEAFDAAILYMREWWKEVPSTELIYVLSNSELGAPRMTVDPAAWEMWLDAVREVLVKRRI